MADDRYNFLVLEETLPEGTIAEHRGSRAKAKRPVPAKRRLAPGDRPVTQRPPRSRKAG